MWEPTRQIRGPSFQIDTNRINARGKEQHMNKLYEWRDDGVINISMSETAFYEALKGNNQARIDKTCENNYTFDPDHYEKDEEMYKKLESILFPEGAKGQNQVNDVLIVLQAFKNHYILITNDGGSKSQPEGIIGKAVQLREIGITVMRDNEAVEYVNEKINERDELASQFSLHFDKPLPEWVGKD